MTKSKNFLLPVAAVILAASLAAFGLFTFTDSGRNVFPRLAYTAVAFVAVLAAVLMRESILRIFLLPTSERSHCSSQAGSLPICI